MKIRVEFDLLIFDCMYVRNIYTYKKIHIYVRIFVCMQLLELVLVFIDFRSTRLQVYVCMLRTRVHESWDGSLRYRLPVIDKRFVV